MNTNSTSNPGSENEEPAKNEAVNDLNAQDKKPISSPTRGGEPNNSQSQEKVMPDPMTELHAVKNPG